MSHFLKTTFWVYSLLSIWSINSFGQELDNSKTDLSTTSTPAITDLKDPDYLVREAAMSKWTSWIEKNPSTSLDELKKNYVSHKSHPEVRARLAFLIKKGMMKEISRVSLGISFREQKVTMKNGVTIQAMKVTRVTHGGACHKAGILRNDIILGFGEAVASNKEEAIPVKSLIPNIQPNTPTKIHAMRGRRQLTLKITFTERIKAKNNDFNAIRQAFEKLIEELDNR